MAEHRSIRIIGTARRCLNIHTLIGIMILSLASASIYNVFVYRNIRNYARINIIRHSMRTTSSFFFLSLLLFSVHSRALFVRIHFLRCRRRRLSAHTTCCSSLILCRTNYTLRIHLLCAHGRKRAGACVLDEYPGFGHTRNAFTKCTHTYSTARKGNRAHKAAWAIHLQCFG